MDECTYKFIIYKLVFNINGTVNKLILWVEMHMEILTNNETKTTITLSIKILLHKVSKIIIIKIKEEVYQLAKLGTIKSKE